MNMSDLDWFHIIDWIEGLPLATVIHSKGTILYANVEALRLFAAGNKNDFIGQPVLKFVHPDSRNVVEKRLYPSYSGGPYLPRQEEKLLDTRGNIFHTEVSGITITFKEKRAIAAFIWDISHQKKLEETALWGETFIQNLFTSLPVGIYFKDREGKYRYINEAYARLTGRTPREMLGRTALECWPEEIARHFHQTDILVMEREEKYIVRQTFPSQNGKTVSGYIHIIPALNHEGNIEGTLGVFMDTTETDKIWKHLEEERERLSTLINASPDIICFKDGQGRWLLANQADLTLFHLEEVNYEGKTDLELATMAHPIYRKAFERCAETDERAWKKGQISRSEEVIPQPDGEPRIFDIYKVPLFNPDGTRKGLVVIGRDVSEAQAVKERLRKSEEMHRAILNALPDLVFTLNREGRFTTCHTSDPELLLKHPEEFLGKRISEVLPPEPAKISLVHLKRVFETGGRETFSYLLTIKGKSRRFETRMVPKGKEEVLAVIRDMTTQWEYYNELQKRERKFRELNQLFQLITDNNPDLLWAKDLEGRFIFTNRAIREKLLFAKNAQEPLGKNDLFFANRIRAERPEREDWHTFGEACINSDEATLKAMKPMRFEEYGNVRGKFLFLDVAKAPLYDESGNVIGTVGSARDVTREKELETAQREAQAELTRLATVVRQATQVIVITDRDGHILYANPAFEKTTGYTLEEVKGKNPRVLKSGRHDKKFYQSLWATITSGKMWEGTFVNRKKSGELYHERAVIFPIHDASGTITQFAAIKQDITREKRLEEQFLQAQKMEAVGNLAGGVAHDFNNLLNVINGYCELGLLHVKKGAPGYKEFTSILSAGKKAAHLVSQLLAFSRRQITHPQIFHLNDSISHLENLIQRLIPENIEIIFSLAPNLPFIEADPGQIEQILFNLVINARDAIYANVEKAKKRNILIETGYTILGETYIANHYGKRAGRYVTLSVSDSGCGMDPATKNKIFEPFFTTKETGKGTGLGLSTVLGIVEQNRGFINVYSEPGIGTTFKIYWPVSDKKPATPSGGKESPTPPARGEASILFVEDVDELRLLVQEALTNFGYTVFTAADGMEALRFLKKKKKIDLLITDIVMPEMNGTDLAEAARKLIPGLKVIFTSGYPEAYAEHNGFTLKDADFLQKPYSLPQLTSKIREALLEKT